MSFLKVLARIWHYAGALALCLCVIGLLLSPFLIPRVSAPPAATAQFHQALRVGDGAAAARTMSDQAPAILREPAYWESQFSEIARAGIRVGEAHFIGSYRLPDGSEYAYYALDISDGSRSATVWEVFVLDLSGTIEELH